MKLERIFFIHLLAIGAIVVLNMLFQEQGAAMMTLIQPSTLSRSHEPSLVLRIQLYLTANVVLIALAPILCRFGLHGIDSARLREQCSLAGLASANVCLISIWIGFFFVPLPPPAWINHAFFYLFLTISGGTAMQLLIQVNAYNLKLTN